MSNGYSFRSAFNGFNREDVVHYIEYINTNHNNQINQLRSELAAAQNGNPAERADTADEQLLERCRQLEERCMQLEKQLSAATAERDEAVFAASLSQSLAAPSENAEQPSGKLSSCAEDELAAYRRAERVERETRERAAALEQEAKERTEAIYSQIRTVLADALDKTNHAFSQLDGMSDQLSAQLSNLQSVVSSSKQTLENAVAALDTKE
jgi:hypothetical protein